MIVSVWSLMRVIEKGHDYKGLGTKFFRLKRLVYLLGKPQLTIHFITHAAGRLFYKLNARKAQKLAEEVELHHALSSKTKLKE